jgi:flavin reductase (DIM6/NTAB) family NADH-FMN oxidoreductase RutF
MAALPRMPKRSLPLARAYRLLEPGPVVLLTTSQDGRDNVMTQSWHTMLDFEPPLVGLVVSNRNYSFDVLKATRECVINIPTARLARQVVGCGNTPGRKIDKFERFRLTREPASMVSAPMIAECYASLECRVTDARMVEKYGLFVVEAVKAWADPSLKNPHTLHHRGMGLFTITGRTIKLPSRMK